MMTQISCRVRCFVSFAYGRRLAAAALCVGVAACVNGGPPPGHSQAANRAAIKPSRSGLPPYPYRNPLAATVLGTPAPLKAKLPPVRSINLSLQTLQPLVHRSTPPTLGYARPLQYMLAAQAGPAPLVFVIAGTGDSAKSGKCLLLSRALYAAGDSVACLPSPTSVTFMLGAARHPVPGRMPTDVNDLYRMMGAIQKQLYGKLDITGYELAGFSLGATEAAFLAHKDDETRRFHFTHVLLLNPAVSVWASVKRMDRLLRSSLPGGISRLPWFLAKTLGRLKQVYASDQTLRFNEDFLFKVYRTGTVDQQNLGAVIGLVFRLSLANMAFAADVMTHSGVIVPKNLRLGPDASLDPYFQRAIRLSFTNYINQLLVPYWNRDGRHVSKQTLIAEADMHSIAPFLASHSDIAVFINSDDPILGSGDIAFLKRVFGSRARIRPHGGHLGNLSYKKTIHALQVDLAP